MQPDFIPLCDRVATSPRVKPYRNIHKALRLAMTSTLDALARVDDDDVVAVSSVLSQVEQLLEFCDGHLRHENAFMHEALRERDPDAPRDFDAEHASQQRVALSLHHALQRARLHDADVEAALYQLYLMLSVHIADHLRHMAEEETTLTEAFWAMFSDREILDIEARLVASLTPAERDVSSQWMLRALNHRERVELLEAMREGMPAAAFDALLQHLRVLLTPPTWRRLESAFLTTTKA